MKRLAITVAVLAALGGGGWYALGHRAPQGQVVPTHKVTKSAFVRRVTADGNLRAVKATPISPPSQNAGFDGPMKIAWIAQDGKPVKAGEVVVRFDSSSQEKQLREGEADLAAADAKLAGEQIRGRSAIDSRDAAAKMAQDELEQQRKFQSKDEEIFSHNTIVEGQIDETLADAKQQHAEKTKEIERRLAQSKTGLITVERQKAQIAIAHAKSALESMEIKAPHDGLLVLRRNWMGQLPRVGEQLWPGQKIAEIPLLDTMEAEVFVLEVDGTGLEKGQKADVTIEARPDITYHGKIKLVDKLAKPRDPGVPVQYFAVVLELDKTEREIMKPGQRVRATLILDQSDALVVPRQAVVNKDGKNVVYRKTKTGTFDPVEVELGAGTSGRVVIAKGLSAGDEIALRDPTRSVDQAMGSGSSTTEEKPK
jgi:RND family efflux transporter MFP subunit